MSDPIATLSWISEFVVEAELSGRVAVSEQVAVGADRLTAEVISVDPGKATIQVYEETTGLRTGDPVYGTGHPLSVTLAPGLLGNVFDGIQRPLEQIKQQSGLFVGRGLQTDPVNFQKRWPIEPSLEEGEEVQGGAVVGTVQETPLIEHRIMIPPGLRGTLADRADEGEYGIEDEIAVVEDTDGNRHSVAMAQRWHVRRPRPFRRRLGADVPLITGQRIIDTLFPIAKGGSAAIPGGFGTGKTVLQHSLAQWSDADIIIYVGCGERGNEMTDVLTDFPDLEDPWSGHPLMERTILIANTSNMPVSARESSIYTGVTIAEYYRDQGYDVALMADSTSRWAQALREISGRLGEMPIEEGYPAYLPARLASFYERAGRVETLSGNQGSVSLIGAVSPPGGDFSEPVTRHTQRFTRCWWALSTDLAHKRHYPAIDWLSSYSLQLDDVARWWCDDVTESWTEMRHQAMDILQQEADLEQLVQLVGPDALSQPQQWVLTGARMLREGFLQQHALHKIDAYAVPEKQSALLDLLLSVYREGRKRLDEGGTVAELRNMIELPDIVRLRKEVPNDAVERIDERKAEILDALASVASDRKDERQ